MLAYQTNIIFIKKWVGLDNNIKNSTADVFPLTLPKHVKYADNLVGWPPRTC